MVFFSFGVSEVLPTFCEEAPLLTMYILSSDLMTGFDGDACASSLTRVAVDELTFHVLVDSFGIADLRV